MLCYHNNVITKGTIVHHIVPIREAWAKRLDPKNCILLCAGCHYAKVHPAYDLGGADKKAMQELLFSLAVCGYQGGYFLKFF
jgi:5-methylcytosine-specific restriction endonuclease McrA